MRTQNLGSFAKQMCLNAGWLSKLPLGKRAKANKLVLIKKLTPIYY
jgi:hypothetical protein